MNTATMIPTSTSSAAAVRKERAVPAPIPFTRILGVELRKMFDTRSGFWLMASIVIASVVATALTIILGNRSDLTFDSFSAAVGIPMSVLLPIVGILAVTSEWSQRNALTTFTLVPSRSRVIGAKLTNTLVIGAVSMVIALGVGAVGNLVVAGINGFDPVWDMPGWQFAQIVLANELGMLLGFTLGLLCRSSAAAIVGYFVIDFVVPNLSDALSTVQDWWASNAGWFDISQTRFLLFDSTLSGQEWLQLAVTSALWVALPFAIGLRLVLRTEVK